MSSFRSLAALGLLALSCTVCSAQGARFEGVGRAATPAEVKAWDIDVRPDFKGLPPGQGSVKRGEQIWEAQCASCHGTFGESNDVFTPIVGYTTPRDVQAGRVAALMPGANAPTRSTLMKVAHLSTLWDYIRRAMPWTAPKTLSDDDVYAKNTLADRERVAPRANDSAALDGGTLRITLPPVSWTAVGLG